MRHVDPTTMDRLCHDSDAREALLRRVVTDRVASHAGGTERAWSSVPAATISGFQRLHVHAGRGEQHGRTTGWHGAIGDPRNTRSQGPPSAPALTAACGTRGVRAPRDARGEHRRADRGRRGDGNAATCTSGTRGLTGGSTGVAGRAAGARSGVLRATARALERRSRAPAPDAGALCDASRNPVDVRRGLGSMRRGTPWPAREAVMADRGTLGSCREVFMRRRTPAWPLRTESRA